MTANQAPIHRKWADLSDESDDEDTQHTVSIKTIEAKKPIAVEVVKEDHTTHQFIQNQLDLLQKRRERFPDAWVVLSSTNVGLLRKQIGPFRDMVKDGIIAEVIKVYPCRQQEDAFDLMVQCDVAEKWIRQGLDKDRLIKVIVSQRNFVRRDNGRGRGRGGRGRGGDDRGEGRGEGRGDRRGGRGRRDQREGPPKEKPVYVNKETGERPNNRKEAEQRHLLEKEREYTKQEAERRGMELGSFRNKPPSMKVFEEDKKEPVWVSKDTALKISKPVKPADDKPWSRKEISRVEEEEFNQKPQVWKTNKLNDIEEDIRKKEERKKDEQEEDKEGQVWKKKQQHKKQIYVLKEEVKGEEESKKHDYEEKKPKAKCEQKENEKKSKHEMLSEDSD